MFWHIPNGTLRIKGVPDFRKAHDKPYYHVVDSWNAVEFSMKGRIESLTGVDHSNGTLADLHALALG